MINMSTSSGNCIVPEEVVIEILSRLPVKSLLRFKCVCKFWNIIIKTPTFINKHLNHYYKQNDAQLLVHHYIPEIDKCRFALFPDDTLSVHQDLDVVEMTPCLAKILGPINGLFFLHHGIFRCSNRVALWNPATREFRHLPVPNTNLPPHCAAYSHYFGFGFDPLTDDYKLVWIQIVWDDDESYKILPPVVALYTLGNDSWRLLEPSLDDIKRIQMSDTNSTTYLNGAYYWLAHDQDFNNYQLVLFDMSSDMFREIKGPDDSKSKVGVLVLHHDSLAVFLYENSCGTVGGSIDVWVMEQEGCWTKHITVKPLLEVKHPLGIWKNEELFLETTRSSQLVLYNPYTHGVRNVGIQGNEDFYGLYVYSYKESLVSVKGGSEDWVHDNLSDALREFLKF